MGATDIEPVEFNAESRLWARCADLQIILGFDDPKSLDKWRVKLGKRFEHSQRSGPSRGVWFYLPGWLRAYDAARHPSAPAQSDTSQPTAKQRRDEARARLEELEVAERERELDANWARKEQVDQDILAVCGVLKAVGGRMCRSCKQVLNDGLDEIQRQHLHRNGAARKS